jgi:hypothetical protein
MFIELKKSVAVRCADGEWVPIAKGTQVNYGSKRDGSSMIHNFHVYVKRVKNRIVKHETVTHTTVTPASEIPEWL